MARHGYTDDGPESQEEQWAYIRARGAIKSAIRGRRGQKALREMRDALDAMPDKRLIPEDLVNEDGDVCAWGCLGQYRDIDMSQYDPEDHDGLGNLFDVAPAMVREIEYENDEAVWSGEAGPDAAEKRWQYMRRWVERRIIKTPEELASERTLGTE